MRAVFLDRRSLDVGDMDYSRLESVVSNLHLYDETRPEETAERIMEAELVISNKIILDEEVLSQAKHLRLICVAATGFNNIDLDAAHMHHIAVCNVRGYATPSVVQHVFMLILNLYRRFSQYQQAVRAGAWSQSQQFCLLDYPIDELSGKTIGVVGYGELGQAVAKLAQAFGMKVLIAQRNKQDSREGRVPLDVLLAQADVVSLHCPLDEHNRNLIGKKELLKMRSNAILINTARGGLVDEPALARALTEGEIAGAGIDVLSTEPPPVDHVLLSKALPNLIITPHIAWSSRESRQRLLDQVADNIQAFSNGHPQNMLV